MGIEFGVGRAVSEVADKLLEVLTAAHRQAARQEVDHGDR